MLSRDASTDARERVMQATAWFFIYRFGARSGEALGLRRKDLVWHESLIIILIRDSDYSEVKSDAGVRQVPLIGPLGDEEKSLLEAWLEHVDEYADSDWLVPLFAERGSGREIVDTDAIIRRISEALRAVTDNHNVRPHHGRHSFGTRLEWLMTLDKDALSSLPQDLVGRVLGPCQPAETRRLLLDTEHLSKRAFWATALAIGHASPDMTLRVYTHLTDLLSGNSLGFLFDRQTYAVKRANWTYLSGSGRLPRRRKAERGRAITLSDQVVRDVAMGLRKINDFTEVRRPAPPLSARRRSPVELTPELIDRAFEIAHRRGRVDTLPQRLMLPPDVVSRLFEADFMVRSQSGYGVPQTRWALTELDTVVTHSRVSARSPSEARRVLPFLRSVAPMLGGRDFADMTAKACAAWLNRYRHDSTALVLAAEEEVRDVIAWMLAAGISPDQIEIRIPIDGLDSARLGQCLDDSGVKVDVIEHHGSVAFARSPHAAATRRRAALLLRENAVGPLTNMGQVHRSLHVMASWLRANAPQ
jgi:hypothetical protein